MNLTDKEKWACINALRVAAEEYERISTSNAHTDSFRETFKRQALEAYELANRIEAAD